MTETVETTESVPPPSSPPPSSPPPAPPVAAEPRRPIRPGPQFWWAGAATATVVVVAALGFLVGRASVDEHPSPPVQIQRQAPEGGGPGWMPGP